MSATYRVNRIPVTDNIRNAVFDLISKENDIKTKKKHPAKWYRTETANKLKLLEKENPSLRSYEDLVIKIRIYLKKQNPLEEPWSYASLMNYPIPQDKIIEVWRLCEKLQTGLVREVPAVAGGTITDEFYKNFNQKWLTIRQVRWYIIMSSIPSGLDGDPEQDTRFALIVALNYAKVEQQAELFGDRFIGKMFDSDTLEKIHDNFNKAAYLILENDKILSKRKLK